MDRKTPNLFLALSLSLTWGEEGGLTHQEIWVMYFMGMAFAAGVAPGLSTCCPLSGFCWAHRWCLGLLASLGWDKPVHLSESSPSGCRDWRDRTSWLEKSYYCVVKYQMEFTPTRVCLQSHGDKGSFSAETAPTTGCMSGLLLRQPSFKYGSGESASGAGFYTTYRFMAGDVISLEIGVIIGEYKKNAEETS